MSLFGDIVRWRDTGEKGLILFPRSFIVKLFQSFAGPHALKMGFAPNGRASWVRRSREPIQEVIDVSIHGAKVNLTYGVALPFVPVIRASRIVLPSTPEKNAPLAVLPGFDRDDYPADFASVQPRPELLAESIRSRVPVWFEIFRDSFGSYRGMPSLAQRLEELRVKYPERKREVALGAHQYLALAFLHARLGERRKAAEVLESTIKHLRETTPHAVKLRERLEQTLPIRKPALSARPASSPARPPSRRSAAPRALRRARRPYAK